jgi:RNA polymerase sigma factor for flagellar operon FliA
LDHDCGGENSFDYYEPLTRSIAGRMYLLRIDNSVAFDDYLQYGRVGLLEALDRFDIEREVSFGAFSSRRIRGAILNGLGTESELWAQRQFWRRRTGDRVDSLRTAIAPHSDRTSLAEMIAITVGLVVGVVLDDMREGAEPADPNPMNDPYAQTEFHQLGTAVRKLIDRLPDTEQVIVRGHYQEFADFDVLAARLSLSKGRISQLHAQALLRLRGWLETRPQLDRKL